MKVREKSISYAATKSSQTKSRENELNKEIADQEKEIDENTAINDKAKLQLYTRLEALKFELEKILEYRTKGAILRSRSRWYNEGEKNTKYFLNLEKRHYKQGTISCLKKNENDFATSDKEILHECEVFYKDLYSSKVETDSNPLVSESFFSTMIQS